MCFSAQSHHRAEPGYQLARQQLQVSSCQSEVSSIFEIKQTGREKRHSVIPSFPRIMLGGTSALCWQQAARETHKTVMIDYLLMRNTAQPCRPTPHVIWIFFILQPKGRHLLVTST